MCLRAEKQQTWVRQTSITCPLKPALQYTPQQSVPNQQPQRDKTEPLLVTFVRRRLAVALHSSHGQAIQGRLHRILTLAKGALHKTTSAGRLHGTKATLLQPCQHARAADVALSRCMPDSSQKTCCAYQPDFRQKTCSANQPDCADTEIA